MPRKTEHPAMPYMRYEARGFVTSFMTDLTNHDAVALAKYPHECFSWIIHPHGTHIAFPHGVNPGDDRARGSNCRFAAMVLHAFDPNELRYFWWDGIHLARIKCAADLDDKMAEHETKLRDAAIRGRLADMGVV